VARRRGGKKKKKDEKKTGEKKMYLIELGRNVRRNFDARSSAANVFWITLTLCFLTGAGWLDVLGFFAALLVFVAFSNQFKLEVDELQREATQFLKAHFHSAPKESSLVEKNAYLLKLGLSSQNVPFQAEATQVLVLKGTNIVILSHELPAVVLTVQGPAESKPYVVNTFVTASVTASAPWNASLIELQIKGCYVQSVKAELWRIVEGAAESWLFKFERGTGTLRRETQTIKAVRARITSEKSAAHLFTTTALDTEKLFSARFGVTFLNAARVSARFLAAQTTCFTDRADGTRVVHRGMWLALAFENDTYALILHTPVNNRVMVIRCCGKPASADAAEVLKHFHAREPLKKIKPRALQIVDCLQGTLNPALTGTDLFGPEHSHYVRFKPEMPLFDLGKPQFQGLGKEQTVSEQSLQVALSI